MRRYGRTETLLLYWFRTPPYVKVGRVALDPEAMAQLERLYPEIKFDWDRILREPPQALSEQEAMRRREQRDARDARRKRKKPVDEVLDEGPPIGVEAAGEDLASENDVLIEDLADPDAPAEPTTTPERSLITSEGSLQKRRRRRRRKRRGSEPGGNPSGGSAPNGSV